MVRTRSPIPVTVLCALVSIKRTQLFSLQDMCKSYQCQDSSASRNFQRALLLPISLAMLSLYALRSTWELRRATELVQFLVWKINKNGKCSSLLMNPGEHRLRLQWYHHTGSVVYTLGSTLQRGCISRPFLIGSKPVFFFRINFTTITAVTQFLLCAIQKCNWFLLISPPPSLFTSAYSRVDLIYHLWEQSRV